MTESLGRDRSFSADGRRQDLQLGPSGAAAGAIVKRLRHLIERSAFMSLALNAVDTDAKE